MSTTPNTAAPVIHLASGGKRNCEINFSPYLDADDDLTGAVAITSDPAGLTFSNAQVSAGALRILGKEVAAGRAVQFTVQAPEVEEQTTYQCQIVVATEAGEDPRPYCTIVVSPA